MEDAALMECSETPDYLDEDIPDFLLFNIGLAFLVVTNFLKDITIVCILHDQTQTGCSFIYKGILVPNNVWVVN